MTKTIQQEVNKIHTEQVREDKVRNLKMKKSGAKYVLLFWVHPISGGDDYQMRTYLKEKPTVMGIKHHIKGKGSVVLTDYYLKKL